ncbi:hypothetical protein ZEAMMB73_Zm00001d046294 [Zea mays]|uniref:Transposase Tnp1/En/Spm-like domain-containing protein n=1 Tax=Zea mays TaxID=4577 RepID=A0A1D6P207_MAIZE|nr:hypothetical protein ZEAMMB73_Zm00001d046294 [Zea mays]
MARGGKQRITRSHDEYLSEDHIGEKSPQTNATSSEQNISNKEDHLDSRSDNESQDITMSNNINGEDQLDGADEVKEVKRRGKTKLINVWNIPRGHRVVVNCNELNQPIGEEAGVLAKFLGMVARNGSLCSLSFKDWRLLIGKKDRNHKQINKEAILNQVKKRFLYPARMETWVLRTIGERWRQHKSNLKSIYFDPHKSQDANNSNAPDGVLADQWVALVNNWMTPKAQREQDPEKKYPHRAVLYIHTHKSNIGNNRNAHVGELKELLAQQPDLADSSNGKDAWEGDALNRILGKEKPGHIHGLGLVPNPKQVFHASTSSRMKHLNVTSLDETSSEDVVSLRLELEKLQKHVQKQDDTILDLQHTVERQKRQHGYLDAPLSPPTDVRPAMKRQGYLDAPLSPPTDVRPAMKRQPIYYQLRSEDSSMFGERNNTMEDENEDDEYEELHSHYKCSKIQDKSKPPQSLANL